MRIRELMRGSDLVLHGSDTIEVTQIANSSKQVAPGSLFVAIHGIAANGHDFLPEAVRRGAVAVVVEEPSRVPADFAGAVLIAPSGRDALNHLSSRFFGDPGRDLFCVGITGTNGKTTVAWMTEAVLAQGGKIAGVIGTVDHHCGGHTWPGDTTPPPLVLQERLAQFLERGAWAAVMEATSQGLSQSRVGSVPYDVAIFTNLTRDHLDYHVTTEAYLAAKERLFTETLAATFKSPCHALINIDTPHGHAIRVPAKATRWTYGRHGTGADLEYEILGTGFSETWIRLSGWGKEAELRLAVPGGFNAANALAAVAAGVAAGCDFHASVEALHGFAGVPGRMQRVVPAGGRSAKAVFVDYAHDPDAIENVLGVIGTTMRRERPGARLVTVVGCGGDRDRGKRPLMLRAALQWSDWVIVTLDNPRSEAPEAIVDDMLAGLDSAADGQRALAAGSVTVEFDRTKAIHLAIESMADGDVALLLGKGHEKYQIVGGQHCPYAGDYAIAQAKLAAP